MIVVFLRARELPGRTCSNIERSVLARERTTDFEAEEARKTNRVCIGRERGKKRREKKRKRKKNNNNTRSNNDKAGEGRKEKCTRSTPSQRGPRFEFKQRRSRDFGEEKSETGTKGESSWIVFHEWRRSDCVSRTATSANREGVLPIRFRAGVFAFRFVPTGPRVDRVKRTFLFSPTSPSDFFFFFFFAPLSLLLPLLLCFRCPVSIRNAGLSSPLVRSSVDNHRGRKIRGGCTRSSRTVTYDWWVLK